MNFARARWRFFRKASGVTWVWVISPSLAAISSIEALGKSRRSCRTVAYRFLGVDA